MIGNIYLFRASFCFRLTCGCWLTYNCWGRCEQRWKNLWNFIL